MQALQGVQGVAASRQAAAPAPARRAAAPAAAARAAARAAPAAAALPALPARRGAAHRAQRVRRAHAAPVAAATAVAAASTVRCGRRRARQREAGDATAPAAPAAAACGRASACARARTHASPSPLSLAHHARARTASPLAPLPQDTFVPVLSLNDLPKGAPPAAPTALTPPRRSRSRSRSSLENTLREYLAHRLHGADTLLPPARPGSRQQVAAGGKSALLFWYRDELYAVEARSPAEGAYSEGFLTARFTQDGCIECPTTKTTFDLKTGEIKAWYPDNPVLRALTPIDTCRPMEVFPVRVADGTVAVDFDNSNLRAGSAEGCVHSARGARRAACGAAGGPAAGPKPQATHTCARL
jgi:nitrite reductase/ring-hydroxylating ferredoxin subunit